MVTIEGIVNPNDSDTYLILSIDIPDDRDINRPVLAIYSGGTSEDGSPAPTTIVNSASGSDGGTSSDVTSALETPSTVIASTGTDDRCEDNERDRDQGRGNNCQRNSGIGSGNQP
jgi:hypothetical protein